MRNWTKRILTRCVLVVILSFGALSGHVGAQTQVVTADPLAFPEATSGEELAIDFSYTTTPEPCDSTLSGIGLRVHFDDRALIKNDFTNVFQRDNDLPGPGSNLFIRIVEEPEPDAEDFDGDPKTNMVARLIWADAFVRAWPGVSCEPPLHLFTANFTVMPGVNRATAVRVTAISTAAGFGFLGSEVFIGNPAPVFRRGDHDASGAVDLTDSLNRLGFLFLGTTPSNCLDASDFDNSGSVDITDSVNELGFLFLGAYVPPPPGINQCGPDPEEVLPASGGLPEQPNVQLGCESYPADC